jgi:hypothetical protein
VLDLHRVEQRIASVRGQLSYAVTEHNSGRAEPPGDNHHDPRD